MQRTASSQLSSDQSKVGRVPLTAPNENWQLAGSNKLPYKSNVRRIQTHKNEVDFQFCCSLLLSSLVMFWKNLFVLICFSPIDLMTYEIFY